MHRLIVVAVMLAFMAAGCAWPGGESPGPGTEYQEEVQTSEVATSLPDEVEVTPTLQSQAGPTPIPTPLPFSAEDYLGWWAYTHPDLGFSLQLPPDWVVEEITTGDGMLNGHLLNLYPPDSAGSLNIRMTFRAVGEDVLLWPTGVGSGEFVAAGTLDVAGQPARRMFFICPDGRVDSIWYQSAEDDGVNIRRGGLEFGFIFGFNGQYCPDFSLDAKSQRAAEMIIASLEVP